MFINFFSPLLFLILLIIFLLILGREIYVQGMNSGFEQGRKFDKRTAQDRLNEALLDQLEIDGAFTEEAHEIALKKVEKNLYGGVEC
jgi:hypothetical protein